MACGGGQRVSVREAGTGGGAGNLSYIGGDSSPVMHDNGRGGRRHYFMCSDPFG